MIFRRLAGAFGAGGPSVDTVLHASHTRPGEYLTGEVHVQGGDHDVYIQGVVLGLVTRVEYEGEEHEGEGYREFHRGAITGPFHLGAGQYHTIPFQLPIPWELPITSVYGQRLPGMTMGVRTELEVAGAVDKSDLDPIEVLPLPSQQRVLDAFSALGFQFKSADLEEGHIAGVHQELPFYQEIEFHPPGQYHGGINEVELTFVAGPGGLAVILEADKEGGFFSEGEDVFGRFHVEHGQALHQPWEAQLSGWLQAVAGHAHGGYGTHGGYGHHDPYGHDVSHGHYENHGHHDGHEHRGGPGWGAVAAAGAAGLVGGVAAGMVADEIFDGDDEEEEREEALEEAVEEARFQAQMDAAVDQAYAESYEDAYEEASWDEEE